MDNESKELKSEWILGFICDLFFLINMFLFVKAFINLMEMKACDLIEKLINKWEDEKMEEKRNE